MLDGLSELDGMAEAEYNVDEPDRKLEDVPMELCPDRLENSESECEAPVEPAPEAELCPAVEEDRYPGEDRG